VFDMLRGASAQTPASDLYMSQYFPIELKFHAFLIAALDD